MEQVKKILLSYARTGSMLEKKGGPEQDGPLFESLLVLGDSILAKFGLPHSEKYCSRLWPLTRILNADKNAVLPVLEQLKQDAVEYLSASPLSPLETLEIAVINKRRFSDVLPELDFIITGYTTFIYEELLLSGKISPQQALEELDKLRILDLYSSVERIHMFGRADHWQHWEKISRAGLRYLMHYLPPFGKPYTEVTRDLPPEC